MLVIGTLALLGSCLLGAGQNNASTESAHVVTLERTSCDPSRRKRCHYEFVEVTNEEQGKDKRHFKILFYMGADRAEGKEDAIARLDRFFRVDRGNSAIFPVTDVDKIGYRKPVALRIRGSKYEFSREDGEELVIDVEKKTRP